MILKPDFLFNRVKSEIELAKYVVEIAGFVNEFYTSTTNATDFRILDIYKHNMKF